MSRQFVLRGALCVLAALAILPLANAADTTASVKVGGFWGEQYGRLTKKWLPHCIHEMEKGGRGEELLNLVAAGDVNAGRKPSAKYKGHVFSDAYPYNVAEAMCLALELKDDPFLRAKLEEWIPVFLAAQEKSGYIHSFHALSRKPHFSDAWDHEFYVMGYFIELGIAHMRLTGGKDRRLFDAAIRCADHLDSVFGPAPKRTWTNGHPGIEYAFLRLADAVNRWDGAGKGDRYARLAQHFIRTQHSQRCGLPGRDMTYSQCEQPAENMGEARGHAVRAVYFYTGMEGVGRRLADHSLAAAADRLFDSAVNRKMYLTGGVGVTVRDEAFGPDYDLPQDGYTESCAGCGLAFWCLERAAAHPGDPLPFDVYERVLYNNVLGAVSRDGENFFYQNPLASDKPRYPWHRCPCCVGNIPRTLFALKDNLVSTSADGRTLYVNNYMDIETDDFRMETDYPRNGKVKFTVKRGRYDRILARFPNRAESSLYRAAPEVEHGYREVKGEWTLPLPEQTVTAIPEVKACAELVAFQRGPIVYSWEGKDFGTKVANYARLNNGGESRVWVPPVSSGSSDPTGLEFKLAAKRRFVLDGVMPLDPDAYWPGAQYMATVKMLPAALRFVTTDGKEVFRHDLEAGDGRLPEPPFEAALLVAGISPVTVLVRKDGKTSFLAIRETGDFEPRRREYAKTLRFRTDGGAMDARVALSAGVGQADMRFVTEGRENRPYVENGRLFLAFSARAYGSWLGVMSVDPRNPSDIRLEGTVFFDYGDGLLRNDIAADLFHDAESGMWRAYASNFSTGTGACGTRGRAPGGITVAWSRDCPLHGVSVMEARPLGLSGMNEDPDGIFDAASGKWRLLISAFARNGIRASLLESDAWDGPFKPVAGPVGRDSTGTTILPFGGRRYCLSGSADGAMYAYSYPDLKMLGRLRFDRPPWPEKGAGASGRVWPAIAEFDDGDRPAYLMVTMDRVNFPGMPAPNWTYGELHLYLARP